MSIERYYSNYTAVCDICGKRLPADSWDDAIRAKREAGWQSRKDGGEWQDICDDCLFEKMGYSDGRSE